MQRFKDKFALITGGTNGMGFATAQQFINESGKVIITGRSAETVNKAVEQLGENAFGMVSNASSMQDIMLLQEQVKQYTGHIDLLFAKDRKSTRLNSSHVKISYAVFCLKK